jgi:hypothetical protein
MEIKRRYRQSLEPRLNQLRAVLFSPETEIEAVLRAAQMEGHARYMHDHRVSQLARCFNNKRLEDGSVQFLDL